ncbi:MAG: hypothetical protein AB1505_32305 [Candidatus Latescibacterota bacterium]
MLANAFPNPFNPGVTLDFDIGVRSTVTLRMLDAGRQTVAILIERGLLPRFYREYWAYMAWTPQRAYVGVERWEDTWFVPSQEADVMTGGWGGDHVELMVDGDHSGGRYWFSADELATDQARRDAQNRQAQLYVAVPWSPDNERLGYMGPDLPQTRWVVQPPYADVGGAVQGHLRHWSVEFAVTAFDTLEWNDPAHSVASRLEAGRIIGFNSGISDFDPASPPVNQAFGGYYGLSELSGTYRDASLFVDGLLTGQDCGDTAIRSESWARVKAAFR